MKGIIIYKGKYGATKQYAHWIAEDTQLDMLSSSAIKGKQLEAYDFLVIGSSVYIGKLQIAKWLKKNLHYIKNKKILLYQVAGTPSEEKEKRQAYNLASIPKEIIDKCEFYFFHGKLVIRQLSWWDRFMLKMGARLTKDPVAKKTMLTDYNDVNKKYIWELAEAVKKMTKKNEFAACAL